jgi:catechol 2,3-dioxygenase-like lactoylglutathione lyase family enzyme
MTQLEHANITVPDVDAAIRFIQLAAPDFEVRRDEISASGYRWVHIGNHQSYIALQAIHPGASAQSPAAGYVNYGVNHLCLRIDDASAVEHALLARGYRQNGPMIRDSHRRRLYFYDDMGLEWEMVEYTSTDPAEMFLYE